MSKEIVETEWSYFVDVDSLQDSRTELVITPDADAAKRLCQRLNLTSLNGLEARLILNHPPKSMNVHVEGRIKAQVEQPCVVTLEPVISDIEEEFEAWFADHESAVQLAKARKERMAEKGHAEVPMLEEVEDPEAIIDGKIDLGELVTQYLSLAINPYPHAEGVEFEVGDDAVKAQGNVLNNPFAALKDWKDKLD